LTTDERTLTDDDKIERARRMHELYSDPVNPMSLKEVGQVFDGLTRERVRQILRDYGYKTRSPRGTVVAKKEAQSGA
jgi:DNA-directed RNA polymerase sigma subunit (sigma70/sigma32)